MDIKNKEYEKLEAALDKGSIEFRGVTLDVKEDILIVDKFIETNIKPHEAIGGSTIL
jgi:hypothetical protein